MDYRRSCRGSVFPAVRRGPVGNEENPQLVVARPHEQEARGRCHELSLQLDGSLLACASTDESSSLRCRDKRRSTLSAAHPTGLTDPPSNRALLHRAIANRRGTKQVDAPV